jgi:hypothetical protein
MCEIKIHFSANGKVSFQLFDVPCPQKLENNLPNLGDGGLGLMIFY